jgi:hypothetical protein
MGSGHEPMARCTVLEFCWLQFCKQIRYSYAVRTEHVKSLKLHTNTPTRAQDLSKAVSFQSTSFRTTPQLAIMKYGRS